MILGCSKAVTMICNICGVFGNRYWVSGSVHQDWVICSGMEKNAGPGCTTAGLL